MILVIPKHLGHTAAMMLAAAATEAQQPEVVMTTRRRGGGIDRRGGIYLDHHHHRARVHQKPMHGGGGIFGKMFECDLNWFSGRVILQSPVRRDHEENEQLIFCQSRRIWSSFLD